MKINKKIIIISSSILGLLLLVGVYYLYSFYVPRNVIASKSPDVSFAPLVISAGNGDWWKETNSPFQQQSPLNTLLQTSQKGTNTPTISTPTQVPENILPSPTIFMDDSTYSSDFIHINIEKISKNNSQGKPVKIYIADVRLRDARFLYTALAKDQFGTNVVEEFNVIAQNNNAIFAVNGDFYGWTSRVSGKLIRNGTIYRDIAWNEMLAFYTSGDMKTYNEQDVDLQQLKNNGVFQSFSYGPSLVKDGVLVKDFSYYKVDHGPIRNGFPDRNAIYAENPRTGVGMIAPNHFIFIVVDGRQPGYSEGLNLDDFAKLFFDKGCKEAYNLDGGVSSAMYLNGKIISHPPFKAGESREMSDIIYVKDGM